MMSRLPFVPVRLLWLLGAFQAVGDKLCDATRLGKMRKAVEAGRNFGGRRVWVRVWARGSYVIATSYPRSS